MELQDSVSHLYLWMKLLAETSLDLVKRQYHKITLSTKRTKIEGISKEDLEHFFFSLAQNLNCCIHVTVKYGDNDHHKVEAAIKSMAVAIRKCMYQMILNKKVYQVLKAQCNGKCSNI